MRQTPDDASRVYLWYDLEWFGRGLPRQHHNLQMSFPITRDKFHIPECDPPLRTSPLAIHDLTKSRYLRVYRSNLLVVYDIDHLRRMFPFTI
ncbi:hypothetical protein DTO166G4_214 [Paecilomyces variotii]|nr:hypothetical protein DTO164E3_2637 [Paecilomyces variotii]KAJ9208691.1 hypothetical protein DTO032I3_668 [Paecilomyces variotii]KAJ9218348.1 hypothetical protein DTO166G4_214 [Paecilomyces variotii]KAJ9235897.1 hypothetical protein DTO166G5_4355 [Paecilomyces variotii]KAJ9282534.1 hypothetical protein DTO021D3_682 [Paecilomyces variotii]